MPKMRMTDKQLLEKWGDHEMLGPILKSFISMRDALTHPTVTPSAEVVEEFGEDIDYLLDEIDDILDESEVLNKVLK